MGLFFGGDVIPVLNSREWSPFCSCVCVCVRVAVCGHLAGRRHSIELLGALPRLEARATDCSRYDNCVHCIQQYKFILECSFVLLYVHIMFHKRNS